MRIISILLGILVAATTLAAAPASRTIAAGQTLTLSEDLVLSGNDTLDIAGTAESPCTIVGNRHQIRTADDWSGSIKIVHCRMTQLGTDAFKPQFPAIDIHAGGHAAITLEYCTFDQSAGVNIVNNGNSTAAFRHNIVLENSAVPVKKDLGNSGECFFARGNSPAQKYFQGNQIYKAHVVLESFKGPLPKEFPFNDEEIKSGKVTVFQMLEHFRDVYTPIAGSPLINAGDPADGLGTPIGVIGAGKGAKPAFP